MRRPLLAVAGLFAAGSLLADGEGRPSEAALLLGLGALLLLFGLVGRGRTAAAALAAAAVALGCAASTVQSLQLERCSLRRLLATQARGPGDEGPSVRLIGTLRGDSSDRDGRQVLVVDAEAVELSGRLQPAQGRARIEIGGELPKPRLPDGDRVALWARLRASGAERVRDGIAAYGFCKSLRLVEPLGPGPVGWVRQFATGVRGWARERLVRAMPAGQERALVVAMVLGDRDEIDDATAEAFRASGTYHVLALSGAQVALVAALLVWGLRWLRCPPWLQAVPTAAAVAFYSLLVGGDVPVVRAALMTAAVLAGHALEVDADAANLLGLAGLLLLADRPGCVRDVGFQLSFGATLGILTLAAPLRHGLPRLPLKLDLGVAASIAAQAALAPVLATAFHRLAPAAVVLNLAAVPLSSAALLSGLAVVAASVVGEGAARVLGGVACVSGRALRISGDLGPLAPWLDVRVPGPSLGILAVHACGLVLLARGRRAVALAVLLAGQAVLVLGPFRPQADGRLHLTVIDVGQGDSLLLRSGAGRALLVDAGGSRDPRLDPGERRVAPVLWARSLRGLDALLVTHAHPDHVGGAAFVMHAFRVAELWEGPAPLRDPAWQRASAALPRDAVRRTLVAGMALEWEGARLTVLGPAPPRRPPLRVRNEDSVVIEVALGEVRLLLTGDVTGDAEAALPVRETPVLKVPHHGSRYSSGPRLIALARPRVALVSAGAHNPFGHPHPEVLERYRQAGALVLRTDRDGDIEVATDGRRIWLRAAGEGDERRIR